MAMKVLIFLKFISQRFRLVQLALDAAVYFMFAFALLAPHSLFSDVLFHPMPLSLYSPFCIHRSVVYYTLYTTGVPFLQFGFHDIMTFTSLSLLFNPGNRLFSDAANVKVKMSVQKV